MKEKPSVRDVLSDIEFELAQGAISHDDLGRGVHAVKRYQNQVRGEMLQASRRVENVRKVINRLFQINDMLITLLQETVSAIQSLRMDLRRVTQIAGDSTLAGSTEETLTPTVGADGVEHASRRMPTWEKPAGEFDRQWLAELESAMQSEALRIKIGARPVRIPIVGRLLRRLREAFHNLVLFYVKRLAERQTVVNQLYGDSILQLTQMNRHQQEQIDVLSKQLAVLQARLKEAEADDE